MDELRSTSTQEVSALAGEFRQLLYDMPFQIPYDIIFLARTVGILSGIATGLHPGFNIWLHLAPYAEKLISEEAFHFDAEKYTPEALLGEFGMLAQRLINFPRRAENLLAKIERGELGVRDSALLEQMRLVRIGVERAVAGIIFMAFFFAAVQFYTHGFSIYLVSAAGGLSILAFWQTIKPRS
jgi:predicted unusual protein kinase regulating ubiquinone biosynthesis (AarF/ABC1/UbiB family)